jgi:hypothetical protein
MPVFSRQAGTRTAFGGDVNGRTSSSDLLSIAPFTISTSRDDIAALLATRAIAFADVLEALRTWASRRLTVDPGFVATPTPIRVLCPDAHVGGIEPVTLVPQI